jgi:hypothetical protein
VESALHTLLSSGFTSENSVVGENMLCQAGRSCYWRAKSERSLRLEDRPCSATGDGGGGGFTICSCDASSAVSYCQLQLHLQIICTQTYVIPEITTGDPGRYSCQPMPFLLSQTVVLLYTVLGLNADSSVYIFYIA